MNGNCNGVDDQLGNISLNFTMPVLREVVEEPEFAAQLQLISPNITRIDEVLLGVTWVLARRPETFPIVYTDDRGNIHVIKTDSIGDTIPKMRIFFRYNLNTVQLLWIEVVPDEEDLNENSN